MDADVIDGNRTPRERWEVRRNRRLRTRLDGLTEATMADPAPHIHRDPSHRPSEVRRPRDLDPHIRPAMNGATR
ncbi:hypothetical protein OG948_50910 (plasmid) [Embleya sp. NBC_00888]|uniref:hypothetical protein n=1 Tax=Embleya sp. NBC_00888 TaxID=2975960 RepID=UPI002F9067B8|nr:hypothetical protein OG948_50910 [Embleya sp. NBC_00888]